MYKVLFFGSPHNETRKQNKGILISQATWKKVFFMVWINPQTKLWLMLVRLAFFATPWICHCTRSDFVIPEVEIKLMATGLAVFLSF